MITLKYMPETYSFTELITHIYCNVHDLVKKRAVLIKLLMQKKF